MNSNKLRGEIVAHGYSLSSFSDAIGIKRTALYRKLKGITEFDRSEIERIADALSLSAAQIKDIFFCSASFF